MVRQKAKDKLVLIIWDSVAGTPSQDEIEGTYNPNERVGVAAKALAKMMRKLTKVLGTERIALVFTNQLKVKIGTMYGDPYTTPGGKAIPYHASVRVRLTRGGNEKGEGDAKDDVIGVNTSARVVKNRLGPPARKCKFFISFANGIEDIPSWFEALHEKGLIEKRAGWCYMDFSKDFKFREKEFEHLVKNDDGFREYILKKLSDSMIVKYGEVPHDAERDPDSLMDNEQIIADIADGQ